ncbi:hypothetical protein Fmac_027422 [Flemingia macrophylla]|uniref:AP2/ERF domain-containing protein n=1 Tax=Flemingia macrophylla TaxID=520843 RepID=A0ABD1LI79_9FABA
MAWKSLTQHDAHHRRRTTATDTFGRRKSNFPSIIDYASGHNRLCPLLPSVFFLFFHLLPQTGRLLAQPQQHRLLRPGPTPPQAFANQIRFRDVSKCPWGGYAGEIRDPVNHKRPWLATIHIVDEAFGAAAPEFRGAQAISHFPSPSQIRTLDCSSSTTSSPPPDLTLSFPVSRPVLGPCRRGPPTPESGDVPLCHGSLHVVLPSPMEPPYLGAYQSPHSVVCTRLPSTLFNSALIINIWNCLCDTTFYRMYLEGQRPGQFTTGGDDQRQRRVAREDTSSHDIDKPNTIRSNAIACEEQDRPK